MMQETSDPYLRDWRRPFWLALLVAASVAFTLGFACAVPFAAVCAVAACTLPRRDAYYLAGAVWLANQVVGFVFLHYPWTADCAAWAAALALCAFLCTLAARQTVLRLPDWHPFLRNAVAFLAAFAAYEATLIACSLWLGGIENFTLAIQGWIFALNAIAFVGLLALQRAGTLVGITSVPSPGR
jgi:hypothetical protein